jgi:hypothetical protein
MALQDLLHQGDAGTCGHIRQSDQACMRLAPKPKQRSEISVDGHQNATFASRPAQQRRVAGIGASVLRLIDVMALSAQPMRQAAPGAPVDQESHDARTRTASILSFAITA